MKHLHAICLAPTVLSPSITRDTNLCEIAMELLQVEKCQPDADGVHAYPKRVKHVMPEGSSD